MPIDGEKLIKQIKQRGLNRREVSEIIERNHDYISCCIRDGRITEEGLQLLKEKFFIDYEDIKPDPQEEVTEAVQDPVQITAKEDKGIEAEILKALYDLILIEQDMLATLEKRERNV